MRMRMKVIGGVGAALRMDKRRRERSLQLGS
jgi:hypothetical protein